MKRKLLLGLCMFLPMLVAAQILKDSTVQVVAYWNKGDSFKYKYYKDEYQVVGNDTTWGDWHEDIFSIEVVDSTESGYVLKYQSLQSEHYSEDKDFMAVMKPLLEKYEKIPVYFSTNEYGKFVDVVRWEEYKLTVDSMFADLRVNLDNYFGSIVPADSVSEEDRKMFVVLMDQLFQTFSSKEAIVAGMDYLIEPLYYHASKLDLNHEYAGDEKFMSPFVQGEAIDGQTVIGIHKVDYETGWVTFHRKQRYEAGPLLDSFVRYLTQNFPEGKQLDIKPDELPFIMVETFFDLDVHVNTGWPGATLHQKTIQVGEKQKVSRWFLEMVFDEE